MASGFISPMFGDVTQGVVRTTDTGGLPPSMLDAMAEVGGLWYGGDHYAKPEAIVRSAREHGVRALRVDARDLSWLAELPDLAFLHIRTDGRPPLDPVRSLSHLRGLTIEVGAVRETIDLAAHPDLRWLKIQLSGKGGAANAPAILAGHAGVTHLRLSEVPFVDLTELATAFPSMQCLGIFGADRLRRLGDLRRPWRQTLLGFGATFGPAPSLARWHRVPRPDRVRRVDVRDPGSDRRPFERCLAEVSAAGLDLPVIRAAGRAPGDQDGEAHHARRRGPVSASDAARARRPRPASCRSGARSTAFHASRGSRPTIHCGSSGCVPRTGDASRIMLAS